MDSRLLEKLVGHRVIATAEYQKRGHWNGDTTVAIGKIVGSGGSVLADHAWVRRGDCKDSDTFYKLCGMQKRFRFEGTVKSYMSRDGVKFNFGSIDILPGET